MAVLNNGNIFLDTMMLKQYSMVVGMMSDDGNTLSDIRDKLDKLSKVEDLEEAKIMVYEFFPKFKVRLAFYEAGVNFDLIDKPDSLTLFVRFPREIYCLDFND